MNILLYFFIFIAILLLYMRFEAGFLKIENIDLSNEKNGVKIVFISDLHIERFFINKKKLFNIIKNNAPDLIILGGDYLDYGKNSVKALDLLNKISNLATTLAVLGNHDYKAFKNDYSQRELFFNDIRKIGIKLLINESIDIVHNNKTYKFTGLDDLWNGNIDYTVITRNNPLESHIVISHNPDVIYDLDKSKINYLLSGHIHGGQIRTPFQIEFRFLRSDKIYKENIISGHHKMNGIDLYLSRGIGNTFLPLRFFARPEVTIINI